MRCSPSSSRAASVSSSRSTARSTFRSARVSSRRGWWRAVLSSNSTCLKGLWLSGLPRRPMIRIPSSRPEMWLNSSQEVSLSIKLWRLWRTTWPVRSSRSGKCLLMKVFREKQREVHQKKAEAHRPQRRHPQSLRTTHLMLHPSAGWNCLPDRWFQERESNEKNRGRYHVKRAPDLPYQGTHDQTLTHEGSNPKRRELG